MTPTDGNALHAIPRRPRRRHSGREAFSPTAGYAASPDGVYALAAAGPQGPRDRAIRIVNFLVASLALILALPLLILIAIAIKLDSRGPVFYRQLRIGLDRRAVLGDESGNGLRTADLGGQPFVIYKFRTMHLDAEARTGPVWAARRDERTTRVGRVLRRYRLDEIPQFLNVLRGEMSVVGPRPERPSFVSHLRREFLDYCLRQRVRPGITGWAQVNQPSDQSLDDVRQKLRYDLEYLNRRSLAFDLRIMLKTLPVMLEGEPTDHAP
ncbi:MAG: sugar transferase [Gemmatimonadota bacterium]